MTKTMIKKSLRAYISQCPATDFYHAVRNHRRLYHGGIVSRIFRAGNRTTDTVLGLIINEGKDVFIDAPWVAIFGGLMITLTTLAFNLLGDGLRDVLDPRLRSN